MKRKGKRGWCEGVGWSARPSSEAERNAVTEVERRTRVHTGRGEGGVGNGSSSGDGAQDVEMEEAPRTMACAASSPL